MKKILFFTPSLRRNGAEINLYNLISCIDIVQFQAMGIVSCFYGELALDIDKKIKILSQEKDFYRLVSFLERQKIKLLKQNYYQEFLIKVNQMLSPDLWYINTIMQPDVLWAAQRLKIPCIVHSHELEQVLTQLSSEYIEALISYPNLIITCSNQAKQVLMTLGCKKDIHICHPCINSRLLDNYSGSEKKKQYRKKFSIPKDHFVWLMSGYIHANKDPLRFIRLAKEILKEYPDTYFFWVGNDPNVSMSKYLINYCETLGISKNIFWIDTTEQKSYYEYLSLTDGFVLTSNSESFSVVLLEAMYLKKPLVCFNCGGPNEIITEHTGIIINSFDESEMIRSMLMIMKNEYYYSDNLARQQALNFSIEKQASLWNNLLRNHFP